MIFENSEGLVGDAYDVCVVGAGPVGISLAVELERKGLSVLLLESGARSPAPTIQELSDAELDPNVHDVMRIAVARMLGGTSNLWGARCIKFDPVDFMSRPGVVDGARWPISYDEILPYYKRACEYTWSGQPDYSLPIPGFHPSDESFSTHTLERWANEQKLQVIHAEALSSKRRIDVRLRSTVSDVEFSSSGVAEWVTITDSESGQKRRVAVKRLVIATGGLESTRLLLALQKKSPMLFGGADGPLGRYYMGHVIGEIADVVLSVEEMDKAFNFFVDEHGSYVRRRFVPSEEVQLREKLLNVALWPVVPPVADPRHGSAILSLVYLTLAFGPLGRLVVAEAIRKRHVPDKPDKLFHHVFNLFRGMPSAIFFVIDFFRKRYFSKTRLPGFFILNKSHRYGLSYHSEQAPYPESRVTLTSEQDRTGLPKIKIDLRFHEKDAVSIVKTHDLFEKWLKKTGVGYLEYRVPMSERVSAVLSQAKHGTHQVGTARMAFDSKCGVVDRDLRTFDCPNLFVASSAVLPTSGQANPTLTVIALALRLAETLAEEIKNDSARLGEQPTCAD